MKNLRTILKWRRLRALGFWNRLPFRAQGGVTVFIPIFAVVISFGFALYGNQNRAAIQDDIQRKFKAVRQYSDLLTLMIDAETGERGYLLTNRAEYLEPYKRAVAEIPNTVAQLKATIKTEPGNKPRAERLEGLAKIQELVNRQLDLLKETQNFTERHGAELDRHLQSEKSLMDDIRNAIGTLQNQEEMLLADRLDEVNAVRKRDYIVVFITLLIGILVRVVSFYLFDRGIVRRINRLTEHVSEVIKGTATSYGSPKKTDAVGMLEKKIVELAGKVENKSGDK